MVKFKLEGLNQVVNDLLAKNFLPISEIDNVVKKESQVLVNQIKSNYASKGHRLTGNLIDSIQAFSRKRKGKTDPYFTYYVGPKYGRGGGNHAHFLEYGVPFSSYPIKGEGKSISGRKYGKYQTKQGFRIAPTGVIRLSRDQKEQDILNALERNLISVILKKAQQKGFKTT